MKQYYYNTYYDETRKDQMGRRVQRRGEDWHKRLQKYSTKLKKSEEDKEDRLNGG